MQVGYKRKWVLDVVEPLLRRFEVRPPPLRKARGCPTATKRAGGVWQVRFFWVRLKSPNRIPVPEPDPVRHTICFRSAESYLGARFVTEKYVRVVIWSSLGIEVVKHEWLVNGQQQLTRCRTLVLRQNKKESRSVTGVTAAAMAALQQRLICTACSSRAGCH